MKGFSARHGFGWLIVGNVFAYRATDIKALRTVAEPHGADNEHHLREIMGEANTVVVAWGPTAKLPPHLRQRWRRVLRIAKGIDVALHCFGTANDGHPRHPLMLAYDTPMTAWKEPA